MLDVRESLDADTKIARLLARCIETLIQEALTGDTADGALISWVRQARATWRDVLEDLTSKSQAKAKQLFVIAHPLTVCHFDHPDGQPCLAVFPDRSNFRGRRPSGNMWTNYCSQHSNGNSVYARKRADGRALATRLAEVSYWRNAARELPADAGATREIFEHYANRAGKAVNSDPISLYNDARRSLEAVREIFKRDPTSLYNDARRAREAVRMILKRFAQE